VLEENKIMADALRKIAEMAIPAERKFKAGKDAFAEAQRIGDEAHANRWLSNNCGD
jgi:hypothetical protein